MTPTSIERDSAALILRSLALVGGEGRFGGGEGGRKVFISHAYRATLAQDVAEGGFLTQDGTITLVEYKAFLRRALAMGLLEIARVDLVTLCDPADIEESHMSEGSSDWHAIIDPATSEW